VGEERSLNNLKELAYKEQISSLENQLENLNGNLTKTKEELTEKDGELKKSNQELLNKSMEIKVLEKQIKEKAEQIATLNSQVNELKVKLEQLSLNPKIEIIDKPSFAISNSEIISLTDSKMIDPCPEVNVLGEEGPEICKKQVTEVTYFKFGNVIRFFAWVGYSFEGAHFDSGQDGFVLAEYKNSKWIVIDFLQVHEDGCWGNSLEKVNQFILGKNSFGYHSISCISFHGSTSCTSYIVGFINDKIAILLDEISSEDNLGEGVKPVINWKYQYKPIPSENQFYSIERKYFKLDKFVTSATIKYNSLSMKYE
ncbi:MAG: hypothetical protein ACKO7P_14055, partial [Bacteroidota bacterium]